MLWDVDAVQDKLLLGLRGGTDQGICIRIGSDISLDLWSSAARRENKLCAVHLFFAFSGIPVVGNT